MRTFLATALVLATALLPLAPTASADGGFCGPAVCVLDYGGGDCGFDYVYVSGGVAVVSVIGASCYGEEQLRVSFAALVTGGQVDWSNGPCALYFGGMPFGPTCGAPAMPALPWGDLLP